MTLFKQVALLVSLVFLLIVVTITVGNLRQYSSIVEGQMQTTAQDMTTTLGIAISNSAFGTDAASYETLFNAVFDSGYYSSIELVSPEGVLIHKKDRELKIQDVPDWFISLVPLQPAIAETQVMQGWVPLGTLRLELHPGYVYSGLYKNLEATITWFVILFSSGMIVLWLLLHKLLKPLHEVKQQADAIHNNQFVKQSQIPRTVELRTVVEAMNRMVDKVHTVFDDQEETLIRYQSLLYEDKLTGLGNRQFFISQLEHAQSEDASFQYHMAVIKIQNLEQIRDSHGYDKSDTIIRALAATLKQCASNRDGVQCARLTNDEFALLIPIDSQPVEEYIAGIFDQFKTDETVISLGDKSSLAAGITSVNPGTGIGDALAGSDFALTQAEATGHYAIKQTISTDIALPQGKMQWRNWLERCIEEKRLFLVKQKVITSGEKPVHQEVYVRLKNDKGETVPAGMFMPMANALNLGEAIDRVVFQLVKESSDRLQGVPVALNLTASVFSHADALVEFNQLLEFFRKSSAGLCVEASHAILEQFPAMCVEVAESVRRAGHTFGIDNLNLGRSLHDLMSVRPDYVKVNAKTIYDMTTGDVPAGYQALVTLTKTLDMRLIAVGVDSEELRDHLLELGVDTMQGNLFGEPEEIV